MKSLPLTPSSLPLALRQLAEGGICHRSGLQRLVEELRVGLWLLLFLLPMAAFANQQQADSLFVAANKDYQQENYAAALEKYKEIEKYGIESEDLLYNIANTYYKLNKIAPAIYYYEKVLKKDPRYKDAEFNLAFAKRMAIDNIEPLPDTITQKFTQGVILQLTYNQWAWIAVGFAFAFGALFLLYHFSYGPKIKRIYFTGSFISAALAVLLLFFAYANHNYRQNNTEAIVFAQQTDVKTAPSMSSAVSFQLHEGTKVKILESVDNWKKIKLADGKIGWIVAEDVKEI